jgi:hypothetical protein
MIRCEKGPGLRAQIYPVASTKSHGVLPAGSGVVQTLFLFSPCPQQRNKETCVHLNCAQATGSREQGSYAWGGGGVTRQDTVPFTEGTKPTPSQEQGLWGQSVRTISCIAGHLMGS